MCPAALPNDISGAQALPSHPPCNFFLHLQPPPFLFFNRRTIQREETTTITARQQEQQFRMDYARDNGQVSNSDRENVFSYQPGSGPTTLALALNGKEMVPAYAFPLLFIITTMEC